MHAGPESTPPLYPSFAGNQRCVAVVTRVVIGEGGWALPADAGTPGQRRRAKPGSTCPGRGNDVRRVHVADGKQHRKRMRSGMAYACMRAAVTTLPMPACAFRCLNQRSWLAVTSFRGVSRMWSMACKWKVGIQGGGGRTVDDDGVDPCGEEACIEDVCLEAGALRDGAADDRRRCGRKLQNVHTRVGTCGGAACKRPSECACNMLVCCPAAVLLLLQLQSCGGCMIAHDLRTDWMGSLGVGVGGGWWGKRVGCAHRELEEPHVPVGLGQAVEGKAAPADKGVAAAADAVGAAVCEREAAEVEGERAEAGVKEDLQDDVLCVLAAHGPH